MPIRIQFNKFVKLINSYVVRQTALPSHASEVVCCANLELRRAFPFSTDI
jgi:hypothetical protein